MTKAIAWIQNRCKNKNEQFSFATRQPARITGAVERLILTTGGGRAAGALHIYVWSVGKVHHLVVEERTWAEIIRLA